MAAAGPVAEAIGAQATFVVAGTVPALAAGVAIVLGKLPGDELAHPLSPPPTRPEAAASGSR